MSLLLFFFCCCCFLCLSVSLGLCVCFYILVFINRVSYRSFKSWLTLNSLHTWSWSWTPWPSCPRLPGVCYHAHFLMLLDSPYISRHAKFLLCKGKHEDSSLSTFLLRSQRCGYPEEVTRWLTAHGTVGYLVLE